MNKAKTILTATVAAGALALGTVSVALAQGPGSGPNEGRGPNGTPTEPGVRHDERRAEVAAALGITVEELDAAIVAGQMPHDIAVEKGIDVTELKPDWAGNGQGQMDGSGPNGARANGNGNRMARGEGAGARNAGDCPYVED